jgi:hypothetical protein
VNDASNKPPTIRFSTDGQSWRTIELPSPDPVVSPDGSTDWAVAGAAATDGDSVVVVGAYDHAPCDWTPGTGGPPPCQGSPISWVSTDGVEWRSSLPWVGPVGYPGQSVSRGSGFGAVWAVRGGWEASLGYASGSAGQQREVWHSSDGMAWEHRADVVLADAPPIVVVGVDGRRLMAAEVHSTSLTGTWTSDDGVAWAAEPFPDDLAAVLGGVGPEQAGEPWLLVGTTLKGGSGTRVLAVWSSSDLREWEQQELPWDAAFDPWRDAMIRTRQAYVAVAYDLPTSVNGATWVSTDGERWTALPTAPLVQIAADGPAGIIGLGVPRGDGRMPVYALR